MAQKQVKRLGGLARKQKVARVGVHNSGKRVRLARVLGWGGSALRTTCKGVRATGCWRLDFTRLWRHAERLETGRLAEKDAGVRVDFLGFGMNDGLSARSSDDAALTR